MNTNLLPLDIKQFASYEMPVANLPGLFIILSNVQEIAWGVHVQCSGYFKGSTFKLPVTIQSSQNLNVHLLLRFFKFKNVFED